MSQVKFNLKDQSRKTCLINLMFNYDGERLKMSTGESIPPRFWNPKSQRVRESIDFPDAGDINTKLNRLSAVTSQVYNEFTADGVVPSPGMLKKRIWEVMDDPRSIDKAMGFWYHFDQFVEYKKDRVSNDVVKDYNNSLRKHLKAVEKKYGMPLQFALLKNRSGGFVEKMDHYLTYEAIGAGGEKGLATNTVGKQFKNLKAFLKWCFDKEITETFSLRHMVTKTEEVDKVYLTTDEIDKVEAVELEDDEQIRVRDLFLIGCETGLRFSDFTSIIPEYVGPQDLRLVQSKTSTKVTIPISQRLRRVLEAYDNRSPHIVSNYAFNKAIKEVCRQAGIDTIETISRKRGNKRSEEYIPKWQQVSSHTCRRSFCTNKYLSGMPAHAIMKFSGHKTEQSFMKYLKLDGELVAEEYRSYF